MGFRLTTYAREGDSDDTKDGSSHVWLERQSEGVGSLGNPSVARGASGASVFMTLRNAFLNGDLSLTFPSFFSSSSQLRIQICFQL